MKGWAELQTEVPLWLNRPDLTDQMSMYASLFEARAGRMLRTRKQETAFTASIDSANQIALPADWAAFKTLWIDGNEDAPVSPQTLEFIVSSKRTTGQPTNYAVTGSNAQFNGTGDVVGVYFAALPSIEANNTNWLSDVAYDAYLFGMVAEGWGYLMNDAQEAKYLARSAEALQAVMATDQRDRFSGPIAARKR